MNLAEWIGIISVLVSMIGGVIALTVKGTNILGRLENRQKDLEDRMDRVHDGCHVPINAMAKVKADIQDLQTKDNDINIKLTDMNNTLTQTHTMTTAMYKHFFEEGIKNGRRREDV